METERAIKPKLDAQTIRQEFDQYTQGVQLGFATYEDGLGHYGRFLHQLSGFLHQPDVSFQPETRQLVDNLFYKHQQASAIDIEFFGRVKERVYQEVLDDGRITSGQKKWGQEVDLITVMVDQELAEITRDFNLERQARSEVEALSKGEDHEIESLLTSDLDTVEGRTKKVKQAAIQVLSTDPQLGQDVEELKDFQLTLNRILEAGQYEPDGLVENLKVYRSFLAKGEQDSWLDDIYSHALSGHSAQVELILKNVLSSSKDANYLWNKWINAGVIPQQLVNTFDETLTLVQLQQTTVALEGMPKEVRARKLLPFLQSGISAGLIREIVNNKYQFPDNLIVDQIDAFLHFYDGVTQKEADKPIVKPIKGRLVQAALLVALVVAAPYVYSAFSKSDVKNTPDEILETLSKVELEELQGLYEQLDRAPAFGNGIPVFPDQLNLPSNSDQPGGGVPSEGLTLPSGYRFGSESMTPKNDSAAEFLNQKKQVLWDLEGKNLLGFYPEMHAQVFDPNTKAWKVDRRISPNRSIIYTFAQDIGISHEMKIGTRIIQIPVKEGYVVTRDSLKITGANTTGQILQAEDGTYFLNFPQADVGKSVKIAYSIGKANFETRPYPTTQDYNEMGRRLFNPKDMPEDVQIFITDLRQRKDMNLAQKAKIAEKYIKDTFKYSLNPKWSDWYLQAPNSSKFIRRIFEGKRTDCDVANTALVAMLRELGIYAKMAYGFNHGGALLGKETNLVDSEYHGWTLAFLTGINKWVSLDATPTNFDDFTQNALEGNLTLADSIEDAEDFNRTLKDLKEVTDDYQWLEYLLLAEIASLSIYAAARFMNRKNYDSGERLTDEVRQRGTRYWGEAATNIVHYFRNREEHNLERYGVGQDDIRSKLWLIPGITFLSAIPLIGDIRRRIYLAGRPYNKRGGEILPTGNESALEFLTEGLGYKEKEAEKTLTEQSRRVLVNQLWDQFDSTVYNLTENGSINRRIHNSLKRVKAPSSEEDWERTKKRVVDGLYKRYSKDVQKILKRQKQIPESEPELQMSFGEFEVKLDQAFRYKLMLWQLGEDQSSVRDKATNLFRR